MSNKNNTPEQKAQWKANQKIGSRFIRVIDSINYLVYLAGAGRKSSRRYDEKGFRTY